MHCLSRSYHTQQHVIRKDPVDMDENKYRKGESDASGSKKSTLKVNDWSRFSEWVHCMCVVTFDLELGQAIETIYPDEILLSEQEKMNICYLAFPDSNSGCMGDNLFHVRFRISPGKNRDYEENNLSPRHRHFNTQCLTVLKVDKAHYWGFVYFRQRKEATLPRGYFQKSFIILTKLPFFALYYEVLSQIAQTYFNDGLKGIISACMDVCNWPPLTAGELLNLQLFDTIYQIIIPKKNSKAVNICSGTNVKMATTSTDSEKCNCSPGEGISLINKPNRMRVVASVNEINIFRSLSYLIPHIFTLWELVLTGEPIVVIGSSPASTSYMVQSLISLISPLEYCAESRPYFTIHDSEFKEFTREHTQFALSPSIIVGVTNPFFIKLFKDWPHMIRISGDGTPVNQLYGGLQSRPSSYSLSGSHATNVTTNPIRRVAFAENSSSLITKYKPYLKKDKVLIKKILVGMDTKRPEHVQSILLRRSLLELTQSFMIPLERYIASLMPLQKDISPFKSAPSLSRFNEEGFLATLEQSGPHLTSPLKGNWKGLYKRFFMSANFRGWYDSRHRELQHTLQTLQLQALSGADLNRWAHGKQEVEIVDMFIKLKQKLNLFSMDAAKDSETTLSKDAKSSWSNDTRHQLLRQIENLKQSLPDDLKTILFNT